MNEAIDKIGFALFAFLALPFAIVPVAFIMAILQFALGVVIAPWIATIAAVPLAIYMARAAMAALD